MTGSSPRCTLACGLSCQIFSSSALIILSHAKIGRYVPKYIWFERGSVIFFLLYLGHHLSNSRVMDYWLPSASLAATFEPIYISRGIVYCTTTGFFTRSCSCCTWHDSYLPHWRYIIKLSTASWTNTQIYPTPPLGQRMVFSIILFLPWWPNSRKRIDWAHSQLRLSY